MGTHTAHIIVGHSHPNDGGLSYAQRARPQMFLSENSRASWSLSVGTWFALEDLNRPSARSLICVPMPDTALECGLWMMGSVLCPELDWTAESKAFRQALCHSGRFEFPDISEEEHWHLLDDARNLSEHFPKIVLNVFQTDCLFYRQIGALNHYQNPMSVSLPIFTRDINRWGGGYSETGSLPECPEDPWRRSPFTGR